MHAAFHVLELLRSGLGKFQLVGVEDVKDHHVVAAVAELGEGLQQCLWFHVEIGDKGHDAALPQGAGDAREGLFEAAGARRR